VIEALFENNLNWAAARARADSDWLQRREGGKTPDYLWIGCSDSRVPAHEIVGLEPDELLVHRNVANLAPNGDLGLMATLHFALEIIKVRHIIVCGHTGCGGVRAALDGGRHGVLDHWLRSVRRLGEDAASTLRAMRDVETQADFLAELNVVDQVRALADNPLVLDAWRRRQSLALHGWIHFSRDGLLRNLETTVESRADAKRLFFSSPPAPPRRGGGRRS
jgi:carbonic anhydrase